MVGQITLKDKIMQVKTQQDLSAYLLNHGLLDFLVSRASSGKKDWFGFPEQRLTAIVLAHDIAKIHADTMSPSECVNYAIKVNDECFHKIIKSQQ
jgi:hypothetical protein